MFYKSFKEIEEIQRSVGFERAKDLLTKKSRRFCNGCEVEVPTTLLPATAMRKSSLLCDWVVLCSACAKKQIELLEAEIAILNPNAPPLLRTVVPKQPTQETILDVAEKPKTPKNQSKK